MNMFAVWRYRRFHESYLLAWLGVGALLGVFIGHYQAVTTNAPVLFVSFILLLGAFRSRRWWAIGAVILAGLLLGALRGADVTENYKAYAALLGKTVTVRGVMSGDAERVGNGQQRITLGDISINDRRYPGELFVTLYSSRDLKRGDEVMASGMVRAGFASYGAAIASGKVVRVARAPNIIRDIREHFATAVRAYVFEPMASLGLGFVVGQRSTLPSSLDDQLKVVGLTHIVVASGYNLTILVRFMVRLLSRQSRYLAFVGSLLMILAFVLFSGLSPSMNRAVIVTILSLLAWYVGRRFHPVLLICYVATVTALWNPVYVWADLGWYLSFFAFAGVLIVAPLITRALYRRREPTPFEQLLIETMSAEVMALPLIAFSFGAVPVFGLISNVLVGPFIPAAMALTALTGVLAMLLPFSAGIAALPTMLLIGYMVAVVQWLAKFPFAQLAVDFGLMPLLLWYGVVALLLVLAQQRLGYNFRKRDTALLD